MSSRRSRSLLALHLAALLMLPACASEQQQTIKAPATSSTTTTKDKQASKTSADSTRKSKPLTSDTTKKAAPADPKQTTSGTPSRSGTPTKQATTKPGAKTPEPAPKPKVGLPPATYAEIAKAYNARASRLQRVWARAVVSVEFTDDEGNRRWEQGEGHFQVIQPSKMALSAGKLSEVMLWIGCDNDRYWFIDAKEKHNAWLGKHSAVTRDKIEDLGMPAAPRDLLALAGITPLPKAASDKRKDPQVRWSADKRTLIFDADRAGAGGSRWRYYIDPKTYEPSRIEVIDSSTDEPILSATLENYGNMKIRGESTLPPRIATRFRCLHHPSGSTLGLSITDATDGGAGRLRDENFNFEALRDLLGIREVIDLDAPRSRREHSISDE